MTKDTCYFTVFGGAYVPERHPSDYRSHIDPRAPARRTGVRASWLVLCSLVAGIAVELSYFAAGPPIW